VLKVVQAHHTCPDYAVFDTDIDWYIDRYYGALYAAAMRGSSREIASVLLLYVRRGRMGGRAAGEQVHGTKALPACLASPTARTAICRQLEQLSAEQPEGQPPFTWLQLEGACQAALIDEARNMMLYSPEAGRTAAQRHTAEAAQPVLQTAIDAWRQLEPSNLKTNAATAIAAPLRQRDLAYLPPLRSALQLAQQQRSPYWVARCALAAVLLSLAVPCEAGVLRAVMEDFSQVGPALNSCKWLLPEGWMTGLSSAHRAATTTLPILRSRLAALESGAADSPQAAFDMGADGAQQLQAAWVEQWHWLDSIDKCAGCGQIAVGLRACSRCRSVKYCSVECHRQHWSEHKHECRPA